MASIQATRLKKGMLIKLGNDLFRVLDLQHFTPGNKRGFVQARMRNIRTGQQADNKFRAEEDVERAHLDERQMQYLYRDGDSFHFMDTNTYEQIHLSVQDSRLTIRGERPAGVPESSTRHYHQIERGHGPFYRAFEFAEAVRHNAIKADLRDGVLTVTLPKFASPPRRIDVQ